MILHKGFFLMLETIHCLFFIYRYLRKHSRVFQSEDFCWHSRHCGRVISFTFVIFLRCVCFNQLVFHFTSERFVTPFSAVADGRLLSLPIIALTFQTSRCCFRCPLSLGLPPLRLLKALSFRSFSRFFPDQDFSHRGL